MENSASAPLGRLLFRDFGSAVLTRNSLVSSLIRQLHHSRVKWNVSDVLRLELLAYRHRIARASGRERQENAINARIYNSLTEMDPGAKESRRILLKRWMEVKWEAISPRGAGARLLLVIHSSAFWMIIGGFMFGLFVHLSWGAFDDSIHVLPVLATHALFPFILLLLILLGGDYWGGGGNLMKIFQRLMLILSRRGRGAGESVQEHAEDLSARIGATSAVKTPIVRTYIWVQTKLTHLMLKSDPQETKGPTFEEVDDLDIEAGMREVLRNQSEIIKLWTRLNLQLMVVAYLCGFFTVFLFSFIFKSAAFHWGTTIPSVVSAERVEGWVEMISIPWKAFVPPPTFEQITATQLSYGEAVFPAMSGWEAWALFLMMAIACYAIFPRLLVCFFQRIRLSYLLASYGFTELRFENLIDGMTTHSGLESEVPSSSELSGEAFSRVREEAPRRQSNHGHRCLLITDANLVAEGAYALIEEEVGRCLNLGSGKALKRLSLDGSALSSEALRKKVAALVADWIPLQDEDRIVFLIDSGQQPKTNFKTRVERIREAVGRSAGIIFMLIGEDEEADRATARAYTIWHEATRKWSDPNLEVEKLNLKGVRHEL